MSSKALELQVRTQTAVTGYIAGVAERLRDGERGQVTTEWLMLMVGIVALASVMAATGLWGTVSKSIAGGFDQLIKNVTGAKAEG